MVAPSPAQHPRFESGYGRLRVWAEALPAGGDIIVYIGGGDRPHLGAISVAGLGGNPLSFSVPGHMDYVISSESAKRISDACGSGCVVVCGIHVDNAAPDEIESLIANSRKCVGMLLETLRAASGED